MKWFYLFTLLLFSFYSTAALTFQTNAADVEEIISKIKSLENDPKERLLYVSQIDHLYLELYAPKLYPFIKREYDQGATITNQDVKFDLYHLMEAVYYAFPNYEKAAPIAYELLNIAKKTNKPLHLYFAYSSIGADEEGLRGSKEALEFYLEAHKHAAFNPSLLAKSHIELALIFMDGKQYDVAKNHLNTAIQIAKKNLDFTQLIYAYAILTDYYFETGDSNNSLLSYKKVDSLSVAHPEFKDSRDLITSTITASQVHIARNNFREGKKLLDKSLQLATLSKDRKYQSKVYLAFHNLALTQNNFKDALQYYKTSVAFKDSIYKQETISQLNSLKIAYDINKKDTDLQVAKLEKQNETAQKWFILVSLTTLLIAAALYLLNTRLKLKASRISEKLSQKEIEFKRIENKNLTLEVELKNKKLADLFLQQFEKAQIVADVVNSIEAPDRKTKKDLLDQLDKKRDWVNFKIHFDKVHEGFFENLQKKSNELTTKDIRYCAYIRMNLTSKEIAIMLGISHRTVQGIRSRVRKKLKLESKEDLVLFLMNL